MCGNQPFMLLVNFPVNSGPFTKFLESQKYMHIFNCGGWGLALLGPMFKGQLYSTLYN